MSASSPLATIAVLGMVKDVPIEHWDASYKVNLRGPVLMAQKFLPDMIKRRHGIFVCVSSKGMAFLGGYETFKAAQLHLGDTLDAELEGTGVISFTIGPGLIPTETVWSISVNAHDSVCPSFHPSRPNTPRSSVTACSKFSPKPYLVE